MRALLTLISAGLIGGTLVAFAAEPVEPTDLASTNWPILLPDRTDISADDVARVHTIVQPTSQFDTAEPFENRSGGAGTFMRIMDGNAFSHFSTNMDFAGQESFNLGNALFRKIWVSSPSSTQASDGLGPLFNARACQSCHLKDGRGHPPLNENEVAISMFLRLSVPAETPAQIAAIANFDLPLIAEPNYGTQLQSSAVPGVPAEGNMRIEYRDLPVELSDGTIIHLSDPHYQVVDLKYGPLSENVLLSPRVTPQMIGLGLLEAVHENDILAGADPHDENEDGISGRPNFVRSPETGNIALGRFGWKAGAPSIRAQSAGAFAGDIGISTPLNNTPHGDCTSAQTACIEAPTGEQQRLGISEAPDPILDLVTFYSQNLAVPARRNSDDPQILDGKRIFYEIGCIACHTPKFVTRRDALNPEQAFQLIWPYSDMLLHDMGPGLADNRPEGLATGQEWRTPPLWGIGLTETVNNHTRFLHDGRAKNLLEAVLWHGGEAQTAQTAVIGLTTDDRNSLLAFLGSL